MATAVCRPRMREHSAYTGLTRDAVTFRSATGLPHEGSTGGFLVFAGRGDGAGRRAGRRAQVGLAGLQDGQELRPRLLGELVQVGPGLGALVVLADDLGNL